jgi:pimeloyl-ACP methyl ester carboxylesterase
MTKGILFSGLLFCCITASAQNTIGEVLNYDNKMEKISLKSEELAYMEVGEGPQTLIFVHGLSSNLEAWNKNIDTLKKNFKCIAIDLPGYGKSSKNKIAYSLSDYAGFINEFIIEKKLNNVVLVGHSMGGQIVLHTALKYPEQLESLIVFAPAGIETFTAQEATIMKASYTPEMVQSASDEQIRKNIEMNFHVLPEDAEFMIEDRIAIKNAIDFEAYSKIVVNNIHAMLNEPVLEDLNKIKIPVLMIFGKNDMLIPNKYFHPTQNINSLVETAKSTIPNLKVEIIDEAGHFVNFEKAEEANLKITCFLKKQ